jgi:hypothetical protein
MHWLAAAQQYISELGSEQADKLPLSASRPLAQGGCALCAALEKRPLPLLIRVGGSPASDSSFQFSLAWQKISLAFSLSLTFRTAKNQ